MVEKKGPSIFDQIRTAVKSNIGEGKVDNVSKRTRSLVVMWAVCIGLIFFIFPLMIGMIMAGFVSFDWVNPATYLAGIVAVIIVVVGGWLP